jgi:hypothetical protein
MRHMKEWTWGRWLVSSVLGSLIWIAMVGNAHAQNGEVVEQPVVAATQAKSERSITLDGRLDAGEWNAALDLGPFLTQFNRGAAKAQTHVKVKWDDANLYVGFDCKDPEPGKIVGPERARDGAIFGDDVVEIMVNTRPEVRRFTVHHMAVSAGNVQFDSRITPDGVDPAFNARWESKVSRNAEGWQCEMLIPLVEIGVSQTGYWDVNFYRENPRLQEYTCWSPTYGPFHTLSRFGKITGIRSKVYGVQTVDEVATGQVKWGLNEAVVSVNNRGKKAKALVVGLDVQSPDATLARFRVDAAAAAEAVTQVKVPYRTAQAGKYQAQAVVEEQDGGRVLAVSPVRFEFAPVVMKAATRSGVIGKPFWVEVKTFMGPEEGDALRQPVLTVRLLPTTRTCDKYGGAVVKATSSPGWMSLETKGFAPGVYDLEAKIERNGAEVYQTQFQVQLDKDILEEKKP